MWPPSSEDSLLARRTVAIAFQRMSDRTRCSSSASPGKGASRSTGMVLTYGVLSATSMGTPEARALVGGALADRFDRRRLLLADQVALVLIAATLCAAALAGSPPIGLLYVLAGLMAGFGAVQNVTRSAIIPNVVAPEHMRSALAINFGLYQ